MNIEHQPEILKIEIQSTANMPTPLRLFVRQWLRQIFGEDANPFTWAEPDWRVLVWQSEQLVSHVDITERTAWVGERPIRLGGIGGVATLPAWRKEGLATAALLQAAAFLYHSLQAEFGLLMCDPAMVPFYQRLGWATIHNPLTFEQPGGTIHMDGGAIMILPCRSQTWPPGPIDLCGPPW
jgi:GNAT superfamily N-acetyltransferase